MGDNVRMGCLPWASFLQAIDTFLPVGGINRGMKGHDQRYLRAKAEISAGKGRGYLRKKAKIPYRIEVELPDRLKVNLALFPQTGSS